MALYSDSVSWLIPAVIMPVLLTGVFQLFAVRLNWLSYVATPLDGRLTWHGKRVFGDHKTWRGVVIMTTGTAALHWLFLFILKQQPTAVSALHGAILGLAYCIAELPNSFWKRQQGIEPGQCTRGSAGLWQFIIDQTDSVLGVSAAAWLLFRPDLSAILFLLISGTAIHIAVDVVAHATGLRQRKAPMKRFILAQIVLFVVSRVLFRWLNKTDVRGEANLDGIPDQIPLVLAANHRNRFDSYLIAGAMSWRHFRRLLPKRYMTASQYLEIPGLGLFLRCCGAYTTAVEDGQKTHYRSKDMLHRGETIMIYPEGRMTEPLTGEERAKVGALWIMRGVENTHILPIKIESTLNTPIRRIFRGGQQFRVTFGPVYRPDVFADNLQPQVNELMATIYAL